MAAPLLYANNRTDVAKHLQRAIEAICAADPPDANSSAVNNSDEAA